MRNAACSGEHGMPTTFPTSRGSIAIKATPTVKKRLAPERNFCCLVCAAPPDLRLRAVPKWVMGHLHRVSVGAARAFFSDYVLPNE